jgi:hypothetical protein
VPNIIDRREILNHVLNVTNEEISFVEVMQLMGRMVPTDQVEYYNLINEELSVNVTVTAIDDSTYSTARPLVTLSAGDYAKVREGELVICPNKQVGYIVAKSSYGSVTLGANQIELKNGADGVSLGLAIGSKLAVFSNASGEGSSAPANRRYDVSKEVNHIQTFKESYKVTDIEMGSKAEFEFEGKPMYFSYEQAQVYAKFLQAVSAGLLFGRQSTDTFNDAVTSATLTDKSGNIVSLTKGLNQYCEEGISVSGSGISTTTYADYARLLAKARAPKQYMILMGTEMSIAHDNMLKALNDTDAISPLARFSVDGKSLDFGADAFKLYGFTFTKKVMPVFDHQTLINFTGSAGYQNRALFVPLDSVNTVGGPSMPRISLRHIVLPATNQINATTDANGVFRELELGGFADGVATSSDSNREFIYEARLGLQVLGKQHFMVVDL